MVEYKDLSEDEQLVVADKAEAFYRIHEKYVDLLVEQAKRYKGVPPSGSDIFNPEVWKDIHWKWYFLGGGQ